MRAAFIIHDKTYGFYIDTASDILIDDCTVTWGDIRPDQAAEGIGQKDVRNLKGNLNSSRR